MNDPFARVSKRLPKAYFNDGETTSAVWFDPVIGTEEGRTRLVAAVKKARDLFLSDYTGQPAQPSPGVVCGGDNKERDTRIHAEADRRTRAALENHPCGCGVCGANLLLFYLQVVRKENGVDPYNGHTLDVDALTGTADDNIPPETVRAFRQAFQQPLSDV